MAGRARTRFLLLLLSWGLLAVPAGGDELSAWFRADPRARAYAGVQVELQELLAAARLQKAPIGPLVDKLREGVSKGVEEQRLLVALRETTDSLVRARAILEQAHAAAAVGEENVRAVSILLQRGLPDPLAGALISYGLRAGHGMRAVRAVCDAVTSLLAVGALGDRDVLRVGELLLAGRLPISAYRSLTSVYLKAKASGLDDREILNYVIIGSLESGGGIVSMDEKIARRNAASAGAQQPEKPAQAADPQKGGSQGGGSQGGGSQGGGSQGATPPGQSRSSDHRKNK